MLRSFFLRKRFFSQIESACSRMQFTHSAQIAKLIQYKQENNNNNKNRTSDLVISASFLPFFCSVLLAKERKDEDNDEITNNNKGKSRKQVFNFIADVVEETIPSIVQIEIKKRVLFGFQMVGSGSGFIVTSDGLILTNAHVVQDLNTDLNVKLNDGRILPGRVVKIDFLSDLAVVKIEPKTVII